MGQFNEEPHRLRATEISLASAIRPTSVLNVKGIVSHDDPYRLDSDAALE
jgi:hypothetical protein